MNDQPSGSVMLAAKGVRLSFGGVKAVDGVDLEVREGEIAALIGPNGAGKTSLFNALSGFFLPDAGNVIFRGDDITRAHNWKRIRKGMSRTFQCTDCPSRVVGARKSADRRTERALALAADRRREQQAA